MPLPVHGGVPIRSVGYFAAMAGVMALAARLPVLGALLEPAGWVMKYLGLPGAAAFLLTRVELEGRPPIRFLVGWLVHRVAPRCRSAGRAVLGDGAAVGCAMNVALAPDASLPRLARGRVHGPARVAFSQAMSVGRRSGALLARPVEFGERESPAEAIVLSDGEVVEVVA